MQWTQRITTLHQHHSSNTNNKNNNGKMTAEAVGDSLPDMMRRSPVDIIDFN